MSNMQISVEQAAKIAVRFRKFARFLEILWLTKLSFSFYLAAASIEFVNQNFATVKADQANLDPVTEKTEKPSVKRNRPNPDPKSARKTKRARG
jgi:hypothetical protein